MKIGNRSISDLWFLGIPFLLMLIANFFVPNHPIWDERLFFPTVQDIGSHYFPSIEQIRHLNSPMGPVYFIIWGFLGKLVGWSLTALRAIHILAAFGLTVLLYKILKSRMQGYWLAIAIFILNPYFLVMTAPLLYTDVTSLIFLYAGVYFYWLRQNRWLAGLFFGLAICTRQLLIFLPFAVGLADLYGYFRGRIAFKEVLKDFIPVVMFLPLFILWDFDVNSGAFRGKQFEEATLEAFTFSMKTLGYSIMLIGLYALPFWMTKMKKLRVKNNALLIVPAALLIFFDFPMNVNAGMAYGGLPDTAGLLDIALVKMGVLSYVMVPLLLLWGLFALKEMLLSLAGNDSLFAKIALVLFVVLESVYAYCWDKHFLAVMPLIFLLTATAVREY